MMHSAVGALYKWGMGAWHIASPIFNFFSMRWVTFWREAHEASVILLHGSANLRLMLLLLLLLLALDSQSSLQLDISKVLLLGCCIGVDHTVDALDHLGWHHFWEAWVGSAYEWYSCDYLQSLVCKHKQPANVWPNIGSE